MTQSEGREGAEYPPESRTQESLRRSAAQAMLVVNGIDADPVIAYPCMGDTDLLIFPLDGEVLISHDHGSPFEVFTGRWISPSKRTTYTVRGPHIGCLISQDFRKMWEHTFHNVPLDGSDHGTLVPQSHELCALIDHVDHVSAGSGAPSSAVPADVVEDIVSCSLSAILSSARNVPAFSPVQTQDLLAHIDSNLHDLLDLDEVSDLFDMPVDTFSASFEKSFGAPFDMFVLNRRMTAARQLLLRPTRALEEVARSVGYPSVETLRSVFHRMFGMTPEAYRVTQTETA